MNLYIITVIIAVIVFSIAVAFYFFMVSVPSYLRHKEAQTMLLKEIAISSGVDKEKIDEIMKHV